ncbi:MAG: hypothetical protein R2875_01055 [Desulfobacterales bacterium]
MRIDNVLEYLAGCLETPETEGRSLDIGGPQILSYADLMRMYAKVRGLSRTIIGVPMVPVRLSAYWVTLPGTGGWFCPWPKGCETQPFAVKTAFGN